MTINTMPEEFLFHLCNRMLEWGLLWPLCQLKHKYGRDQATMKVGNRAADESI